MHDRLRAAGRVKLSWIECLKKECDDAFSVALCFSTFRDEEMMECMYPLVARDVLIPT